MISKAQLEHAVAVLKAGDWHAAHEIAQSESDPISNWLHAILHKIEGDVGNSHYWYARTHGMDYDDFANTEDELSAILKSRD